MEDYFTIDIPDFHPKYVQSTKYSYDNEKGKANLKKLLTDTSEGYCMYCYSKILIEGKNFGQLEHSIEKASSLKLKYCIVNISIACPTCNSSFKRIGENLRKFEKNELIKFEKDLICKEVCNSRCEKYKDLQKVFMSKEAGKIILQPFGLENEEENYKLSIQFDLLKQEFIPNTKVNYSKQELNFIKSHINRFNLNDVKFRTREITYICQDIIEHKKIPNCDRCFNLIGNLFIKKLEKMKFEIAIKLVNSIYLRAYFNNKA